MKLQSSSNYDTSTLPTIPDNSFINHDQKCLTKPYFHPLLLKIKELESTLIKCDHQKLTLLEHQQQLKRVLKEKVRLVQTLLSKKTDGSYQQSSQQCQETHQNQRIGQMNYGLHRQSLFKPAKTHRKFYSALNSPRAQLSDQSNTLQNSRVQNSLYTDEEIIRPSQCKFSQALSPQAKIQQNLFKSSKIRKQKVQSYINKYESIQAIWNESDKRHQKIRHSQLRKTYL